MNRKTPGYRAVAVGPSGRTAPFEDDERDVDLAQPLNEHDWAATPCRMLELTIESQLAEGRLVQWMK